MTGIALSDMRTLSFELNPSAMEKGLVEALEWLAREYRQKHGLTLALNVLLFEQPMIDDTLKAILYRAVHELARNIIKHSGVNSARISLSDQDNELSIRVDDAGKGFDTSTPDPQRPLTFGLFSIAERLRIMKGEMNIVSAPGQGTSITLRVPLTPGDAGEGLPLQVMSVGSAR
ncbi:MAG: ATP-binding protein [Pseudomonadota bacterium]